ncbi:MAG: right-handed parallel beta-helix repeat-containing protein [Acidobacteria bacterium]|nr:right-handed parallel beta-helix repeat-containing protein [Acidobacteriota bacterium]MCA1620358.1 right-handed parallel beta-helix repeat-containing protein [Acidobacteriota bacterium]
MVNIRAPFRFFVCLTFILALSAAANAQATRTWVSAVGDDVNPCSRTAPCKTYAGAISKTAVHGEISTLDPGVFVEDCVLDGSTQSPGRGIEDVRSGGGKLIVTNTTVRNMSGTGIVVIPASGSTRIDATLDNVRVYNCAFGVVASSGARMSVSNSVISNNTNHGLGVESPVGASEMHVSNCRVTGNGTGLLQAAGGTMRVANSDVTFNTANGTSGTILSYGNNRFAGNGGASTVTTIGVMSNEFGQQ